MRRDWGAYFFAVGLIVYLATRLFQIIEFPISFYSDEALPSILGSRLISKHFYDASSGAWFPVYFNTSGERWHPYLLSYIHGALHLLMGPSIFVVRLTSIGLSTLAPIFSALILRDFFRSRLYWLQPLIWAATPAWFIHSRTGFECAQATGLYAAFLWVWMRWSQQKNISLIPVILIGAFTFYSFSVMQLGIPLFVFINLIALGPSFWKSSQQHSTSSDLLRSTYLPAILMVTTLLPFTFFLWRHPNAFTEHLRVLHSPLMIQQDWALKLGTFLKNYIAVFSPQRWLVEDGAEIMRHRFEGYGHLWAPVGLLSGLGILVCFTKVFFESRSRQNYLILIVALSTLPVAAATTESPGIMRILPLLVPLLIASNLTFEYLLDLNSYWRQNYFRAAGFILALVFGAQALSLLRSAVSHGKTWYTDYGLYGLQFGTKELFTDAIPKLLKAYPEDTFEISPNWANGTNRFLEFYESKFDFRRVTLQSIPFYLRRIENLPKNRILAFLPHELNIARKSGLFTDPEILDVISSPDGKPAFYFARIQYSKNAEAQMEAQERKRRELIQVDQPPWAPSLLSIRFSQLDIGNRNRKNFRMLRTQRS